MRSNVIGLAVSGCCNAAAERGRDPEKGACGYLIAFATVAVSALCETLNW